MKRLLDKTWAKLTSFFLTLLFGTMTVLGGLGVGILVSCDVFLDGGAYMRETMYESQCSSAIHNAYYYLRGTMANAGLLADDTPSTDTSSDTTTGGITDEEQQQVLDDLPRAFSESFSREDTDCHLAVINKDTREITFENFELTDSDKPLYSTQRTFTLIFADGTKEELTIAADLLPADEFPGYSYLVMTWLLEHIGLTVFLTVLFLLLTLLCFGFSMASAGHWAAHEGVHLTWLDKIPADVWLVALICAVFAGWDVFYELAFAVFCAALAPVLLLFLVRLCSPVQGRDGAAGYADRTGAAAAVAHHQGGGSGPAPHRCGTAPDLENHAGDAGGVLRGDTLRLRGRLLCGDEAGGVPCHPVYRSESAHSAEGRREAGGGRLLPEHRHQTADRRLQALWPADERAAHRHGAGGAGSRPGPSA